jgi:hypothetical protein
VTVGSASAPDELVVVGAGSADGVGSAVVVVGSAAKGVVDVGVGTSAAASRVLVASRAGGEVVVTEPPLKIFAAGVVYAAAGELAEGPPSPYVVLSVSDGAVRLNGGRSPYGLLELTGGGVKVRMVPGALPHVGRPVLLEYPPVVPFPPVQLPLLRPNLMLSISRSGVAVSAPSQLKTKEKVLAEEVIWNSNPVMVQALAVDKEPIVARVPSSFDTVKVHPSGVSPEAGTLYANEYQ